MNEPLEQSAVCRSQSAVTIAQQYAVRDYRTSLLLLTKAVASSPCRSGMIAQPIGYAVERPSVLITYATRSGA